MIPGNAMRLCIYTDENAMSGDRLYFEVLIERARLAGLAGATVLCGLRGFGASSVMHGPGGFNLSPNLPLVVEIVDDEAKLRPFVDGLESGSEIGLVTLETVEVVRYGGHRGRFA